MKLMRDVLRKYKESVVILQSMLNFIDYLLRLPDELSKQLTETIRPIIQKEVNDMIQYEKENWSPTMAAILDLERKEWKQEGIKEGIIEERTNIARALLQENMPVVSIVSITKLPLRAVEELKKEIEMSVEPHETDA